MTDFSSLARAQWTPRSLAVLGLLLATAGAAQAQQFGPVAAYGTGSTTPSFAATGDLNGDGRPDIVAANTYSSTGSLGVLLQQAAGGFAPAVVYASGGSQPQQVALGDVNGDGRLDAVVVNFAANNVGVLLGTGTGTLGAAQLYSLPSGANPFGLSLADINKDGRLDIVTGNSYFNGGDGLTSGSVSILLNGPGGAFGAATTYVTGGAPRVLALADFNKDGTLDIAASSANTTSNSNGTNKLYVLLSQGSGYAPAVSYPTGDRSYLIDTGDLNRDGQPDLVFDRASNGGMGVLLGRADGTFGPLATYAAGGSFPTGVALGDVNGDNLLDAVVGSYYGNTADVLLGTGTGTFGAATAFTTGSGPYGIKLTDMNADGRLDIVAATQSANTVSVLLNTTVIAAPTLTSLNPTSGPVGTSVTLTGTNLAGATGVSFNGTAATAFTVVNATTLTATVPTGASTGNVTVTTGGGVSNGVLFTVAYPDLVVNTPGVQVAAGIYNSLTVNSPGSATLAGNVTVSSAVTVNSGATLNDGCAVISGAGTFTLAAGGTLGICAAEGISSSGATGAVQVTGTRSFSADASYVYNGPTDQNTGTGLPATVRSLSTTNARPVTLSASTSVTQVVTVGGSGNLTTPALSNVTLTLLSTATSTGLVVNAGTGSITGSFQAQRYLDGSLNAGLGYRQFGAPVSGATVGSLSTATAGFTPVLTPGYNGSATPGTTRPFPNVFAYDETRLATASNNLSAFDKGFVVPAATTTALASGQGYDVNIAAGQTVTFAGSAFSGNLTKSLSRGPDASAGWALLGNPYPAPLDYSLLAPADRPGLDAAIYVVQSSGQYTSSYRSYVNNIGNPVLPLGQGFFTRVSAGQTSGTLTFRNSQRKTVVDNTAFQRTAADPRPLVQLDLAGQGLADAFIAYAEAGATPAFDREFDAAKLPNPSGLNLASATATDNLAIDGRPAFTAATALPLTVGVPAAGTYTLSAAALNNLPAGLDAYLRDAATGQTVKLRVGTPYSFSVTAAQATAVLVGRFTLQFSVVAPLATAASLSAADVTVYPNPAHARFTVLVPAIAAAPAVQAELLNTLGQVVRQQAAALPAAGATLTVETAGLAAGIYTLRLRAGATTLAKRVVIQ